VCWGTYVPLIAYGGRQLGGNRYGAFLCVGLAYFLIAVLLPLALFMTGAEKKPTITTNGVTFSALAGVAGALGALCVIFAAKASPEPRYALYIAPIIFTMAPILNTLISLVWQPGQSALQFGLPETLPGWKFYIGVLMAAVGAGLVLYSKEEGHDAKAALARPPAAVASVTTPKPGGVSPAGNER
jgi:uncharacterized membrane protein